MIKLSTTMVLDFVGCWVIEIVCKALFADLAPKAIVLRGRERREKRRAKESVVATGNGFANEKKTQ
jgi:cation-transporting ATPase 13A1